MVVVLVVDGVGALLLPQADSAPIPMIATAPTIARLFMVVPFLGALELYSRNTENVRWNTAKYVNIPANYWTHLQSSVGCRSLSVTTRTVGPSTSLP